MTVDEYVNKVKSLYYKISELDLTVTIFKSRMQIIIVHGLSPKFRSFITAIQN